MKRTFFLAIAILAIGFTQAQTTATVIAPTVITKDINKMLVFTNDAYDFGKIPAGKPTKYELEIKNISNEKITLKKVEVGCGCTTPEYEKDKTFSPGETIKVTLGFSGNANGPFSKSATLYFSDDLTKPVTFKGDAYQVPVTPAPTNPATEKIKTTNQANMKQLLIILFFFVSVNCMAQTSVKFATVTHTFGKIKQNKPATYEFIFTNTGTKPLVIETATAGCGCTTPAYTKLPIAKGQTEKIKVTYNAATIGTFNKDVTVKFANVAEPTILKIDGEVVAAKK